MTNTNVLFSPLIPNDFTSSRTDMFRFDNREMGA